MAVIDCHVQDIPFSALSCLVLIEKKDCCFTYEGFLRVLGECLPKQEDPTTERTIPTFHFSL